MFSNSVWVGDACHVKPGLLKDVDIMSAKTVAWLFPLGKYAQNLGCCHFYIPGIIYSSVSYIIWENSTPSWGGTAYNLTLRNPGSTSGTTGSSRKFECAQAIKSNIYDPSSVNT